MKFKSFAILGLLVCVSLRADTVVMKNLEALHGDLVKDTPDWIELRVEYGTLKIPRDKILRIETDTPEMLAEREVKAAKEKEFTDKMISEGKVKYHNKWVTPAEKAADEKKIADAKKKRDEEVAAAKKKAAEALAAQKKEQELAAQQELAQAKAQALIDQQIQKQKDDFFKAHRNSPYRGAANAANGQLLQQLQQSGF
jgi:hypothetical protein